MTIHGIKNKCENNGYNAEILHYASGFDAVCVDIYGINGAYTDIQKIFRRNDVVISWNAHSVIIMLADDAKKHKAFEDLKQSLVNVFWAAIHSGKNQNEAKLLQQEYAVNHNAMDIYNHIYA